jgi:aspartokinase
METIAVYWESKIRVYGLTRRAGLSLHTMLFPVGRLAYWGGRIRDLAADSRGFELVNLQTVSAETLQFCLLLAEADGESPVRRLLEDGLAHEDATSLQTIAPVALIYLHGPHFQDRYGITEAALSPLQKADIPVLATGCSGTSVYIVVPEDRLEVTATCLAETFVI